MPSSSRPMDSSSATDGNLPPWRRAKRFRRLMGSVIISKPSGLISYGTDLADTFRQVGVYTGNILKGAKPTDLPVVQGTRFAFVVKLQTAKLLGIEVPPSLLAIADELIE
jgi:hypothetical protein